MEQELISKKELLEKYAISYGALYRWKRQGLIPEEWFIKKSTVTGQETFFPKALICQRVELIRGMKGEVTLEALKRQLNEEEEEKAVLILNTVFGEKRFYFSDIHSVMLDKGNGKMVDITQELFGK